MGWEGGVAETNFEKDNSAFSNSVFKTQIIHAMTQVSQVILSTIVWISRIFTSRGKIHNWGVLQAYMLLEHDYMNISD